MEDLMNNNLDELETDCKTCHNCGLADTRTNVVFGVGNKNAEIMFIGEAPGQNEDIKGEPFIGRSGMLLDNMLSAINLNRDKIYISNIVKCHPPKNRNPYLKEQNACIEWLNYQIKIINPKIIVCLGRIAAIKIIKPDFKITKDHGQWFEINGVFITATFHPASLLRNPSQKPDAINDYLILNEKVKKLCKNTY
jgi:DNA polymerase